MPQTAQLIISIDTLHNLVCEAPGRNGSRQKIEGITFADLPQALQIELQAQLDQLRAQPQPTLAPSIKDRPDPEVERQRRNEEAARQRKTAYENWFNSLTKQEQENETAARLKREEHNKNKQGELARNIWYTTAARHGTKLANRVIADPKRRPRVAKHFDTKTKLPEGVEELKIKISL